MTDLTLFGHSSAEGQFLDAVASGKLHHGWLIEGPSGIGKARLATRLAIRLLGGDPDKAGDVVTARVVGGAHPDFRLLSRTPDDKGTRPQDIAVSDARELNAFFQLRPALGGARVGVIDSLDELNRFGANAILKTLEEPPANAVLLLISHGTRPVLPTIRSRCRTLKLAALSADDVKAVVASIGDEVDEMAMTSAGGRPGLAIRYSTEPSGAAARSVAAALQDAPRLREARVAKAVSAMAADDDAFYAGVAQIMSWVEQNARTSGPPSRLAWSECWLDLSRDLARSRELSSDSRQTAAALFRRLQSALEF